MRTVTHGRQLASRPSRRHSQLGEEDRFGDDSSLTLRSGIGAKPADALLDSEIVREVHISRRVIADLHAIAGLAELALPSETRGHLVEAKAR